MFRTALFWGLTLMLVAVIVSLVIRSRHEEKLQAASQVEIVRQSKPTATRVLLPQDLIIVDSKMNLTRSEGEPNDKGATAHHQVVVRNDGPMEYRDVQLRFTYLDAEHRALESRTCIVTKPVPPRQTESLGDIAIEHVPLAAISCTTQLLYADLK